jgi:hypothetical protein
MTTLLNLISEQTWQNLLPILEKTASSPILSMVRRAEKCARMG